MDLEKVQDLVWSETNDWQMSFHDFRKHNNVYRGRWAEDPTRPGGRVRELTFNLGANSNYLHEEVSTC